jgi:hypothetical protein
MDVHREPKVLGIHQPRPLPALARLGRAPPQDPQAFTDAGGNPSPPPISTPRPQVVLSRVPCREVMRQEPPWAARPQHVDDRVEGSTPRTPARSARLAGAWQPWRAQGRFALRPICRIRERCHPEKVHVPAAGPPFLRQFLGPRLSSRLAANFARGGECSTRLFFATSLVPQLSQLDLKLSVKLLFPARAIPTPPRESARQQYRSR